MIRWQPRAAARRWAHEATCLAHGPALGGLGSTRSWADSGDAAMSQETAVESEHAAGRLRSPVRVAVVDVASPLGDLDCTRPSPPPYTAAWILVCRSGARWEAIEIAAERHGDTGG